MAITIALTGRLADITSYPVTQYTNLWVKAPSYRPGPGVEITTSAPQKIDLENDGTFSVNVVEGVGWLYLEGNGWTDSIRFVAAKGMTTIWEAVVNALPIVVEAKKLLVELGENFDENRNEIRAIRDNFQAYVESTGGEISEKIQALNEAFEASAAGQAIPPYLTQEALNKAYGFYVTDEATLDFAIANFKQINIKPGVTFPISNRKNIPKGTIFNANGSTLINSGTGDFLLSFADECEISGVLTVRMEGTETSRGVLLNGNDIKADSIRVISSVPATGKASGYAAGVAISGNNIDVGEIIVENFEFGVNVISYVDGVSSNNITISSLNIHNYLRGLWVRDVTNLSVNKGNIQGASPNSQLLAGHNGILVEGRFDGASRNLRFSISVSDSGEHGIRIGGQFPVRNVWFSNSFVGNSGGCGFKVLGGIDGAARHYNINYLNCIVEDAGQDTQNKSAFLIERVSGGTISNAIVRKMNKPLAAYNGIRLNNCQEFIVSNANISDVGAHGFDITGYSGSCERVTIAGGIVRGPGNCGINIDFYNTKFRRVTVTGRPTLEVSSGLPACRVSDTGGTRGGALGGAFIEFIANGSSVPVSDPTKSFIFDIYSDSFVETDLVNGSMWRTRNDGVIRRKAADSWGVI